jgi:cellobiose-specific phosphotransferase system component IIC
MGAPTAAIWTLPSIFAAVIATSSLRAAVLVAVNFLIYGAIYYPFFKIYEKRLLEQEQDLQEEQESKELELVVNNESKSKEETLHARGA